MPDRRVGAQGPTKTLTMSYHNINQFLVWFGLPSLSCHQPTLVTLLPWSGDPNPAEATAPLILWQARAFSFIFGILYNRPGRDVVLNFRSLLPRLEIAVPGQLFNRPQRCFHPHSRLWSIVGCLFCSGPLSSTLSLSSPQGRSVWMLIASMSIVNDFIDV